MSEHERLTKNLSIRTDATIWVYSVADKQPGRVTSGAIPMAESPTEAIVETAYLSSNPPGEDAEARCWARVRITQKGVSNYNRVLVLPAKEVAAAQMIVSCVFSDEAHLDLVDEGEVCGECGRVRVGDTMVDPDTEIRAFEKWVGHTIDEAREELARFQGRFEEDPMRAFDAGSRAFEAAAQVEVCSNLLHGILERRGSRHPLTLGEIANHLEHDVEVGAEYPPHSSSPTSDLMALHLLRARTRLWKRARGKVF